MRQERERNSSVSAALHALATGKPAEAEKICSERLDRDPNSIEMLRLLGRALAVQSKFDAAEVVVRKALAIRPDFVPLMEDLGGIFEHQERWEEAVATYREALKRDPQLPHAGKKLGAALAALGRGAEADTVLENWLGQSQDRASVAIALDHMRAGRNVDAIATLKARLRINPDNVDALFTLAQAWWGDDKRLSDIEALLRRATKLAPGHAAAWMQLGSLLQEADRPEEAIACYLHATRLAPGNAAAWAGLGAGHSRIGEMDKAREAYARSVALQPDVPGFRMSHAHVLKTLGLQEEALREYRAAVANKPEFGEAFWSMANLKVFRFEPEEVVAMEEQLKRADLSETPAVHFHFALGKAWEDAGDYDRAWAHYHRGNQRQRPLVSYDPVGFETRHEQIAEVFSREFLDAHTGVGFESQAPIFIVGLPRSGSTLIEQVLASHSQVEGTFELPILGDIAVSTGRYHRDGRAYPAAVRELRNRDFRAYGKQYVEETRVHRSSERPRFTDKLPNNFAHVGFAHLILPNAQIINARRHPLDSCLGSYKQLFAKGQNFTYDMNELALYYRTYHDTMQHWHRVLPGKVLDVHYEEMVGNLEAQVRRILAHCGLPFEESCLRFHETQRPVRTASSEQVRQPLYTRALGTWRRYEKHLASWVEELEDIIAELPDSVRNAGLP